MDAANRNYLSDLALMRLSTELVGFTGQVDPKLIRHSARQDGAVSLARRTSWYLSYVGFGMSLARVSVAFGRDRSTIGQACRFIEDLREQASFDAWLGAIESSVLELPSRTRLSDIADANI